MSLESPGYQSGSSLIWDATGFFHTQFAPIGEGRSTIRVYSFRDLVSLRTLRVLRGDHKVSLQHLRKVADKLSKYSDAPFAEAAQTNTHTAELGKSADATG